MKKKFTKGQVIFWRWKRGKDVGYSAYHKEEITGVSGDLVTFDNEYSSAQTWVDTNEMNIKWSTQT